MALSKSFTAKIVSDEIRNIAEELGSNRLQPKDILDFINLATLSIYKDLPKKLYEEPVALTITNDEADISAITVEEIIFVDDSANGEVIPVDYSTIRNLANNSRKQNNVYYSHEGQKLKFYKGDQLSSYGTVTLTYIREIELVADETDKLDVPDRFVPKVIEIAKSITYEKLRIATNKGNEDK